MRSNTPWITTVLILLGVIAYLSWQLFSTPATPVTTQAAMQQGTSTVPVTQVPVTTSAAQPLSDSVVITAPQSGETVGQSFEVKGTAPSGWYFEAVFPIVVRDPSGNIIANAQGQAQSDWTQPGNIPFVASTTLSTAYHGPATLILMKDNPSGLPENDDSTSITIVIQ